MKSRFSTYDIVCSVSELQRLIGLRVNQIYDIDNRTYLIRFSDKDTKVTLLLESGNRFHTTAFEWPKNVAPSGFTMKLRKHLKNKRLEKFTQLGLDRIVDFQFGVGEAAYHVILELYDRGNIVFTDYELTILNILRPHVEGEEVRFAVREKYPEQRGKNRSGQIDVDRVKEYLVKGQPGDSLKKVLNPMLDFGPAVIDHVLLKYGLNNIRLADIQNEAVSKPKINKKGKLIEKPKPMEHEWRVFDVNVDLTALMNALNEAESMLNDAKIIHSNGYIIQTRELRPQTENTSLNCEEYFVHNIEYHPFLFAQHTNMLYRKFDSFDSCVDEFYSTSESQKIDIKTMQQERDALKKLSNVKRDHCKRLDELQKWQIFDKNKAELITRNSEIVDNAITVIRSAIAAQYPWPQIQIMVKEAQVNGDVVANSIKQLKLEKNAISMILSDPFEISDEKLETTIIDIDLGMSAYANATRYYDYKRQAAKKQQRTIESSTKALKSAERKTQQSLKEMRTISIISKARKSYWFEKFYWFISTENYLVIGGRDQQQNEQIVKRYMRPSDVYVHAEIQGASSVVIRNPSGLDVPPKTLLEAGTMAISYSVAWDAKVITNAYWVRSHQVSKTAPTGEYLGTGSFMIRGKKNFLPPCHLQLGISFLFKLEESSVARHAGERKVRSIDDDDIDDVGRVIVPLSTIHIENEQLQEVPEDEEIALLNSDDDSNIETSEVGHAIVDIPSMVDDSSEIHNPFPDTHITIEHSSGKVSVQMDPVLQRLTSTVSDSSVILGSDSLNIGEATPVIIHTGAQSKVKQQKKDRDARKGKRPVVPIAVIECDDIKQNCGPKRGQKGKLKKIREKYRDQDEDEKRIRMDILKSAGTHKNAGEAVVNTTSTATTKTCAPQPHEMHLNKPYELKVQAGDDDEAEDAPSNMTADLEMLDSLTGCPLEEDELLFAVPVVAPYQALTNYKYKVKITPGTGKRGKASKTAMLIFTRSKACTQREKDLFKGVKDETMARNMPGKVKLSAPKLQTIKI